MCTNAVLIRHLLRHACNVGQSKRDVQALLYSQLLLVLYLETRVSVNAFYAPYL
jgi:hypothetical protein